MKKNYDRNISMVCPVCGNNQFSMVDSNCIEDFRQAPYETRIQCSNCKKIFLKSELLEGNQKSIDGNVDDMMKELSKDIEKDIKKRFKKVTK